MAVSTTIAKNEICPLSFWGMVEDIKIIYQGPKLIFQIENFQNVQVSPKLISNFNTSEIGIVSLMIPEDLV